MSVLARHQWFVRTPPRLQADLSPLSASSAGSPGLEEEDGSGAGECAGYGGSLIMVQHECGATEQAAEAEIQDGERLCSVVLDPLPSALLESLSARGHVRMLRPPAAATSWPPIPSSTTTPTLEEDHVRGVVHDLVAAVEDESLSNPPPEAAAFSPSSSIEHRHRKKSRKARRESHDGENKRKHRKRSTSSSSGSYCTTPGPSSEVELRRSTPRVNPIFVWVKQSESTITEVLCEDYDKRNRIRLTKTPNGWRAIPRTERLAVMQPTVQQNEGAASPVSSSASPRPSSEVTLDLSSGRERTETENGHVTDGDHEQECQQVEEHHHDHMEAEDHVANDDHVPNDGDHVVDDSEHLADADHVVDDVEHVDEHVAEGELLVEDNHVADVEPVTEDDHVAEEDNVAENDNVAEEGHVLEDDIVVHDDHVDDGEPVVDDTLMNTHVTNDDDVSNHVVDDDLIADDIEQIEEDAPVEEEQAQDLSNIENDFSPPGTQLSSEEVQNLVSDVIQEFTSEVNADFNADDLHEFVPDDDKEMLGVALEDEEEDLVLCLDVPRQEAEEKTVDVLEKLESVEIKPVVDDGADAEKKPPPAHASSLVVKKESTETATDLSACKRRRRLSGILPCRSPLRLPRISARPLPSPISRLHPLRRSPSPAHQQKPCVLPTEAPECGIKTPKAAHQIDTTRTTFLEGLLAQQPLALDTPAKRPAVTQDPPAKRRKSEDITLRNLLGATPVQQEPAPRSRLLELLTTSSTPARKPEPKRKPPPPAPAVSPPMDALAQLRLVLNEVAVPDPLLVPRSRLAALLASPAAEIPRLVRSPPPTTPDTLAVSLSRLQALLRRPDSELLAWAAKDWAYAPKPQVTSKTHHHHHHHHHHPVTKSTQSILKTPSVSKAHIPSNPTPVSRPTAKTPPTPKPAESPCSNLPWWLPSKPTPPSTHHHPPPPHSADVLAAFHAMYGPTLIPNFFPPPHFPGAAELSSLWPGALAEVSKIQAARPHLPPPPPVQKQSDAPPTKPRIACKSLTDLLAKKPRIEEAPALNLARPPAKHERREQRPQPPTRDSSCPRLWHPLFGSQKCETWNWRSLAVHGE